MKTIFISVGMHGRSDYEVCEELARAYRELRGMYGEAIKILDNFRMENTGEHSRLYYLGEAIKKLGKCDACYFCKGWQEYKGCTIEHQVCELYGIEIIEE